MIAFKLIYIFFSQSFSEISYFSFSLDSISGISLRYKLNEKEASTDSLFMFRNELNELYAKHCMGDRWRVIRRPYALNL